MYIVSLYRFEHARTAENRVMVVQQDCDYDHSLINL